MGASGSAWIRPPQPMAASSSCGETITTWPSVETSSRGKARPPALRAAGRERARATRSAFVVDDAQEALGLERGAADERPVDVGLRHERCDVVGLDAAAVEDAQRLGRRLAVRGADARADACVDLLRLVRRRVA